jgi:hypothetical protein
MDREKLLRSTRRIWTLTFWFVAAFHLLLRHWWTALAFGLAPIGTWLITSVGLRRLKKE